MAKDELRDSLLSGEYPVREQYTTHTARVTIFIMEYIISLILDSSSDKSLHVCSKIGKLICLKHVFSSYKFENIFKKYLFFTRTQRVLCYHII